MILLLYLALLLFSATAIDGLTLLERKGLKECQEKNHPLRSVQFENVWRPTLRQISRHGLGSIFKRHNNTLKVAIIGAGPTGLTAAYELAQYAINKSSRIEVTFFEKTDRIGGRVKTVGNPGHFLPEIWNNLEAFAEAGAMRLPLPPQYDFDCLGSILPGHHRPCKQGAQCNISKMNDAEISDLVHQKGNYSFIDDQIFPMFLIRHYMRKFNVPVKRFNMDVSAKNVFGKIFVHNYEAGTLTCKLCGDNDTNLSMDQFLLKKILKSDKKFVARIEKECHGSLDECFRKNVTDEVTEYIKKHVLNNHTRFNLTTWENYHKRWAQSTRDHLLKKNWPQDAIEIYAFVYDFPIDDKMASSMIESFLGRWWQSRGMFCPKDGMHTLYRKKPNSAKDVSAFYDELLKMNSSSTDFKINFSWNSNIKQILQNESNGLVSIFKEAPGLNLDLLNAGDFDAVIITVPVNFLRDLDIWSPDEKNPNKSINLTPKGATFGEFNLFRAMLQFKTPFWNNTANNMGNFSVTEASGFTVSTDIVGQFRYPRPEETGNIILLYVYPSNSGSLSHRVGQHGFMKNQTATWGDKHFDSNAGIEEVIKMTLRELQKFHPHVKVAEMYTGNYFVQPWNQLSTPPSGLYQMKKMLQYVDKSPKGIYFAGDGFSFKPQWQEGGLYAAYHAIWRLVHDVTGDTQDDPFQVLPPKDAKSAEEGGEGNEEWQW